VEDFHLLSFASFLAHSESGQLETKESAGSKGRHGLLLLRLLTCLLQRGRMVKVCQSPTCIDCRKRCLTIIRSSWFYLMDHLREFVERPPSLSVLRVSEIEAVRDGVGRALK
jgi:hypothetical protein